MGSSLRPKIAAAVALTFGSLALVAPTLVVCEGVAGHAEIETALAPCCDRAPSASMPVDAPRTPAAMTDGCADDCFDTPLLGSALAPAKVSASHSVPMVPTSSDAVPSPAALVRPGATFLAPAATTVLDRTAVLRI